ncbi:hypothetical protein [Rhabdaerophilum sp.]|uniref:hypothetical protein n=1 Tax=Rhabdaerophilum sp. TaxID=2717341 RepID=UPI0038D44BF6
MAVTAEDMAGSFSLVRLFCRLAIALTIGINDIYGSDHAKLGSLVIRAPTQRSRWSRRSSFRQSRKADAMALDAEKLEEILKTTVFGEFINNILFSAFMYFSGLFDSRQHHILTLCLLSGVLYFLIFGLRKYILIEIELFKAKAAQKADQQ